MPASTLTLLHISDLHDRGPREKDTWRRRRVLGDAWERNLDEIRAEGLLDLVCFTGDAAFSGKADEYARVTEFFGALLERLGLGWDRFFLVPGNHDVDRTVEKAVWKKLREKLPKANRSEVARWLTGGGAPLGFKDSEREKVFSRQAAYREWVRGDLGLSHLDPVSSPHGKLGYRKTLRLPGQPFDLHVVGLDSAWMCGDDSDAGKLWLTDDQVMRLATEEGRPLEGFRLCLVHHPLDEIADGGDCRRLLADHVDLVLRGHLHDPEPQTWEDPERSLRQVAAGCLYEHDTYPNACERIRITLDEKGRPLGYDLWFRGWSKRGLWYSDNSLYRGTVDGRFLWKGARRPEEDMAPRAGRIFVGREPELEMLEKSLLRDGETRPVAICAVQGMPGVGKSYLAERFVYLHRGQFPGGVYPLVLDPESAVSPPVESLLSELANRLKLSQAPAGLADRVRARLLLPKSLLEVENVDSEGLASTVAGLIEALHGCPALVTGRYQGLGGSAGWGSVQVRPFDEKSALEQLAEELGPEGSREEEESYRLLVKTLGFLPLAVHLAAGHLRAGRSVGGFLERLRQSGWALPPADPADPVFTGKKTRALLASTFSLSLDLLRSQLGADGDRLLTGFYDLGHAPASGFGSSLGAAIAGLPDLAFEDLDVAACQLSLLDSVPPSERRDRAFRVHPLLAELLRERSGEEGRRRTVDRMTEWFVSRLPGLDYGQEVEEGKRWKEVQAEPEAMTVWLPLVPEGDAFRVEQAGARFAAMKGPFHSWTAFCEQLLACPLEDAERC